MTATIPHLDYGAHASIDDGACLLEAAAYYAGEPFSDHPQCVCPVIAAFGRSWNDGMNDEDRNRWLPQFVPLIVGTRSTPDVQDRRAFMAADWAVRMYTPVWLRAAGLEDHALALEQLPELTTIETCKSARPTIAAAGAAAWDAAWDAARAAAGAAARAAAWDAAWAAAGDAARAAAWAAARAAARAALRPHVEQLQASAAGLLESMIAA